jgi:hypothetical protein
MLCAAYVWAVNRSTASLPMPPPPALPPRPVVPVYFRVRTFSGHPSHRPAAPPAPRGHLDQSRWPSCALRPGTWRSRGRRAGALPGSARALRRIDAESRPERDAGRHRPQGRCIGQPPADRSGPPGACSSEVLSLGCWSGPERVRLGMPRYLLGGPARGPLASGLGMTVAPCRSDDLGGGVTGPGRCRRRR